MLDEIWRSLGTNRFRLAQKLRVSVHNLYIYDLIVSHLLPGGRQNLNHHALLTNEKSRARDQLSNWPEVRKAEVPGRRPCPLSAMSSPPGRATFQGCESDMNVLGDSGILSALVCQENSNPNTEYLRPAISTCTAPSIMLTVEPGK